jgi:hypothetical protein
VSVYTDWFIAGKDEASAIASITAEERSFMTAPPPGQGHHRA